MYLTELTGQTRHLEGQTVQCFQINTLIIMQMIIQIVAFSLQTDGSGWPVLTKQSIPSLSWKMLLS